MKSFISIIGCLVMLLFCTYQVNSQDRPKGGSVEGPESFGDTSANAFPNCGIINYAGKTYHTVVIGAQCWMRENLNVGRWIDQSQTQKKTDSGVVYKYCFSNDFTQCDLWGGLYQWDMLMNYTTAPGGRGICPEGWHVPTSDDLYKMIVFLGGNDVAGGKLKTTGSRYWKLPNSGADNSSGFTAMPAGYYDAIAQRPQNRTVQAAFWSSTKVKDGTCVAMFLNFRTSSAEMDETLRPEALSVRCIKDQ